MNRTRIDWCDKTWNPITGCLGPNGRGPCSYCYARRIAERFGGPDGFKPAFHSERLYETIYLKKPQRIFAGSMSDMWGSWVPTKWLRMIYDAASAPRHTYLFLTKNPTRYYVLTGSSFPKHSVRPNWWLGATFDTGNHASTFRDNLGDMKAHGWHTWASAEPLLEDIAPYMDWEDSIEWLVIGAQTGPGSQDHQPRRAWVEALVEGAKAHGIPVFMKRNLQAVWGAPLIQELPKETA